MISRLHKDGLLKWKKLCKELNKPTEILLEDKSPFLHQLNLVTPLTVEAKFKSIRNGDLILFSMKRKKYKNKASLKILTGFSRMKNQVDHNSPLPNKSRIREIKLQCQVEKSLILKAKSIKLWLQCPINIPHSHLHLKLFSLSRKYLRTFKSREKWTAGRILIRIEMGIQELDQQRQSNHK